jgi:hypothetical protein
VHSRRSERRRTSDIVLVEGVAAVDDHVVGRHELAKAHDGGVSRRTGGKHDPDGAGQGERLNQGRQACDRQKALIGKRLHGGGVVVMDHAAVPGPRQATRNVGAHAAQSDNTDLHPISPLSGV